MNTRGKKALAVLLTAVLALGSGGAVFAADAGTGIGAAAGGSGVILPSWMDGEDTGQRIATSECPAVQVNGQYVDFGGLVPVVTDGRTMLPFKEVLAAMDGVAVWDAGTGTVVSEVGGVTIRFVEGVASAEVERGGKSESVSLETAPVTVGGRIYVPARFFAETMGYAVGWDYWSDTVVIIDFDTIFGDAEEDFSIFGTLLNTGIKYDPAKTLRTVGEFKVKGSAKDEASGISGTVVVDGTATGYQAGLSQEMAMAATFLLHGDMEQGRSEGNIDYKKNMGMEIRLDGETGDYYVKSPDLNDLMGFSEDAWVYMDVYSIYDEMGIDLDFFQGNTDEMYNDSLTVGEFTDMIAEIYGSYLDTETYDSLYGGYQIIKLIFGDEAFVKNGNTYTAKLDKATLISRLKSLTPALSLDEINWEEAFRELADLRLSGGLSITQKADGALERYALELDCAADDGSIRVDLSGTPWTASMRMDIDVDFWETEVGGTIEANVVTEEVNRAVNVEPPKGAEVIDYEKFLEER